MKLAALVLGLALAATGFTRVSAQTSGPLRPAVTAPQAKPGCFNKCMSKCRKPRGCEMVCTARCR